jgi:hypothetical protein
MFTAISVLKQAHVFNRHNPVRSHLVILKALFVDGLLAVEQTTTLLHSG